MMNVIIAAKFLRAPKKLAFDDPKTAGIALGAIALVLAVAFGTGYLARGANGAALEEIARLQVEMAQQQVALDVAREDAQREVNAIAARVGELQAQANRLNALGDRLTRVGKLKDGEFNFNELPGQGGSESASDVLSGDLLSSLDALQSQFSHSGRQLSVLESLLFDQKLDNKRTPAGMPAPGYISSVPAPTRSAAAAPTTWASTSTPMAATPSPPPPRASSASRACAMATATWSR
jgi:hypothetical protein